MAGDPYPTVELSRPLPLDGPYQLNPDHFVLEPAVRFLRVPVLRGRFAATAGRLVLGAEPALELELEARSLRVKVPGLSRALTREGGLCASVFPKLRFTATSLEVGEDGDFAVTGRLDLLDLTRELSLSGRLVHVDELAVVLWVKGVLPSPRRPPKRGSAIARAIAARPLHLELAAEFVQ